MNEMTEQDINDKDLLIQAVFSDFSNDVEINDGFEQTLNENVKLENPGKNALLNEFDWDSISVAENAAEDHEENYLTDFPVPSFEETVGSSEAVSAKYEIQEFCKSQNMPFETLRSDKVYLKLVCKHFGEYRNTRGEEKGSNDGEGVLKRPNRKTVKVGCTAFIHIKLDTKDVNNRWYVNKACFDHTHPMMQSGSTPSAVLEMLKTRDVWNANVIDLTNIQQQFYRDDSIFIWNFIRHLETTNHHVRYLTNEDNRIQSIFFIHQHGIEEARKLSECVIIDATYKTNSHKMMLLNFVVAGALRSQERPKHLSTVPIAGCWMDKETAERYQWSLQCFRDIVSRPELCTKDVAIVMKKYLEFIMRKANFWAGYHVNALVHMGNRTFNRVEATHANIKRHTCTSSGSIAIVTSKISAWAQKREEYRDLQSTREALTRQAGLLDFDIMTKVSRLQMNITNFALESIKSELLLSDNNGVMPLKAISKIWRIHYIDGSVATIAEITKEGSEKAKSVDDLGDYQSRLMIRFEKFSRLLKTASSQQEKEIMIKRSDHLYDDLICKSPIETALSPATVVTQKGRPRSTKREKLGLEHEDDAIKKFMLNTLRSYRNINETMQLDMDYLETKLNAAKSLCLDPEDHYMWFDTIGCPQLNADTMKRPVVLLSSSPRIFKTTGIERDLDGSIVYNKCRQTFVPFFELDTQYLADPIIIFLTSSHFYLLDRQTNVKSKKQSTMNIGRKLALFIK
ncbi:hypothetical protein INT47_009786 [Mucor saturninus]|uniref:ZSWIM1/3 RNaseH-like domain-containing protein n=1 Tax=Mucor saturninus TaxID=64648 RepID=A0A8H7UTU2_9FUNG|nr:hypothetical protein INT47_009786 [Mucor saturninus]